MGKRKKSIKEISQKDELKNKVNNMKRPLPYDHPDFDPDWRSKLLEANGVEIVESQRLFMRDEPLSPELEPYKYKDSVLGNCIKHPLVFSIPHPEFLNAHCNAQLKHKTEYAAELLKEKNFSAWVFLHERPFRFEKLAELRESGLLPDSPEFWNLFVSVYTDSENWFEGITPLLIRAWLTNSNLEFIRKGMSKDEKFIDSLGDVVRVTRGWSRPGGFGGYSWTTNKDVSRFFATRFSEIYDGAMFVAVGSVRNENILGAFDSRDESEVFVSTLDVDVDYIENLKVTQVAENGWVSFDFDGCLHDCIDSNDPRWFDDCSSVLEPNERAIEIMRDTAQHKNIAIVTARDCAVMNQVFDFIVEHDLPVRRIIYTNNKPKADALKSLKACLHYDDREPSKAEQAVCEWERLAFGE